MVGKSADQSTDFSKAQHVSLCCLQDQVNLWDQAVGNKCCSVCRFLGASAHILSYRLQDQVGLMDKVVGAQEHTLVSVTAEDRIFLFFFIFKHTLKQSPF